MSDPVSIRLKNGEMAILRFKISKYLGVDPDSLSNYRIIKEAALIVVEKIELADFADLAEVDTTFVSVRYAAKKLGVGQTKVKEMCRDRLLIAKKFGKNRNDQWQIYRSSLMDLLKPRVYSADK